MQKKKRKRGKNRKCGWVIPLLKKCFIISKQRADFAHGGEYYSFYTLQQSFINKHSSCIRWIWYLWAEQLWKTRSSHLHHLSQTWNYNLLWTKTDVDRKSDLKILPIIECVTDLLELLRFSCTIYWILHLLNPSFASDIKMFWSELSIHSVNFWIVRISQYILESQSY